jgi:hypothetical protein
MRRSILGEPALAAPDIAGEQGWTER